MKKITQSRSIIAKVIPLFFLAGVSLTGIVALPEKASAYHETNRPDVERSLAEGGWIVAYSKEFSHDEYIKLSAALAGDALGGSGSVTSAYFANFARESLQRIISSAKAKAPQTAEALARDLTLEKLLSAIRTSFNGKQVGLSVAGMRLEVGRATYNRRECLKVFGRKKCVSTPNTYQPYIRFKG
jgi:hypothetical protein